jgi:hypothetical protein
VRKPLWLRLILVALITAGSGLLLFFGIILTFIVLWQQPWFQQAVLEQQMRVQMASAREPDAAPEQPYTGPLLSTAGLRTAADLFRPTNIWEAHLIFTEEEWTTLGPRRIPPVRGWLRSDGTPLLRNPQASRAGIAGVLGYDLPWSSGDLEFGELRFTNAAARFKGNGTFLAGMKSYRRPFKLDLNEHVKDQKLVGRDVLNFHNLEADRTHLSDTLAYEFFHEAGVPALRTTFARLFLTIEGRWERRLLGLYLMVENPDDDWIEERFNGRGVALFKPVTQRLFEELGDDWSAYEEIYDPKTKPTEAQQARLMELCRLTSRADDAEFNRRLGEYVDLEQFARYLACVTLLSSYDSILDNGQNYLLWLDPQNNKFGLSPWDLDHSWGEFPWIGTLEDRERASLFHPWIGEKRFLERLFAADAFEQHYRRELRRLLDTLFIPERLHRRIDALAAAIRPAIAEESSQRLARFERAIGEDSSATHPGDRERQRRREYRLKDFITARAQNAMDQLEGRSTGVRVRRNGR